MPPLITPVYEASQPVDGRTNSDVPGPMAVGRTPVR